MDPRNVAPQSRSANHSKLMAAMARTGMGEKVNACPYGCTEEELDEHGYCYHLVGFTNNDKWSPGLTMEPFTKDVTGRRVVKGSEPEPVLRTDHLERITISSRVYRKVPKPEPSELELEEATRP